MGDKVESLLSMAMITRTGIKERFGDKDKFARHGTSIS